MTTQKIELTPATRDFLARAISQNSLKKFYADPAHQAAYEAWKKRRNSHEVEKEN